MPLLATVLSDITRLLAELSRLFDSAAAKPSADDETLGEVAARVHSASGHQPKASFDVLWNRKSAQGSPLASHVAQVQKDLLSGPGGLVENGDGRTYDPALALSHLLTPEAQGGPFGAWSRDLAEMTVTALGLLRDIMQARAEPDSRPEQHGRRVWAQQVAVADDAVGDMLLRARAGANGGRSTKSKVVACPSPAYAAVMDDFGLAGVAAYPVFLGSWWMALLLHDFDDWRLDYLCILDYSFFFEYNVDKAGDGSQRPSPLMQQVAALWDMPSLSDELRVRRSHMLCSMAFFDLKRTHEAAMRNRATDGRIAWIHAERDAWRDFKALDSGGFAHYLSFAPGVAGRDDMMLSGLVNDWVDIGPDLRYQECNQSVLALTRGSLAMRDLLVCYERTVWMLNANFTTPRRHVGCMTVVGACVWEMCNHRQDVWRYYSLAHGLCAATQSLELYKTADLADCYTPDLVPREAPDDAGAVAVPRRSRPYKVCVDGGEYTGSVALHEAVCDAVDSGLLPASVVDYQVVLPLLLRRGELDSGTFLRHMDGHYCAHFAQIMRSGHANDFSRAYGRAVAALVMEGWWSGIYFAIGVGSLVEAQPDRVANDRSH